MIQQYDKYQKFGDLHWQWYQSNNEGYRSLVDESLVPFQGVNLGTVVDVGCGDGLPLFFLNQMGFRCYGVEPERDAVELAMRHNVRAEYFIETAEKFAKRGMGFDYLYCLNTIEHLDDPQSLIKIARRIRNFSVIVTDNKDTVVDRSRYHKCEFSPVEFEVLFKDFELERLPLSHPQFFGYIIKNKK